MADAHISQGRMIDTTKAHPARMYDYLLGGKDNFPPDREGAEQAVAHFPALRVAARENRRFMARMVRYLVSECGIRQFLDIGSGIPTSPNLHEVAQELDPTCRVVYADNDPIVLAHARALLVSAGPGTVDYVDADIREPELILKRAARTLDLSQPVALMIIAVLHFIPDDWQPQQLIDTLVSALSPGSFVAASHATKDFDPVRAGGVEDTYRRQGIPLRLRSAEEFEALLTSKVTLVDPGTVLVSEWRPTDSLRPSAAEVSWYGALGRIE